MKLLKQNKFYIQLYKNKLIVKHLDGGNIVTKKSIKEFSNNRSIIADYLKFESLLRELIKEFKIRAFINLSHKFVIHVREEGLDDLSSVEKRALLDSSEHAGGKEVVIYEGKTELLDHVAISLFTRKNNFLSNQNFNS